jgi:hypothetical protein
MPTRTNEQGYITLFATMIAGAIGVAIALPILLLGIDTERQSLHTYYEAQAVQLIESCIEHGLYRIKEHATYTGEETLAFGGGNCVVMVKPINESTYLFATSSVSDIVKTAQIKLISTNPITIE